MVTNNVYNVGDIRRLIKEASKSEFEPVLGANVERDNKTNNGKAYKDAEKRAKDYDGGLGKEKSTKLPEKNDFNRTTLDYNPRVEPDTAWKKKVEAQAKGYTSELEEKNDIEKSGEFDKNEQILKQIKDANKKIQDERNDLATSGLVSKEMDKKGAIDKKPTMVSENIQLKPKRLVFKRAHFLNEEKMLRLIPDEYKKNGQKIYMQDAYDNEYIVECVESKQTGFLETNIVSHTNKKQMNEQLNRIQQLFAYDTRCTSGRNIKNNINKINEQTDIRNMINLVKNNNPK